ncbi:hypothetical protein M0R72_14385 [Candidatus Pacearchaeota archaeon]|jgi:hypothetical protein|nr:hypothetical protein [Candidatus Pacearchaeota archaeon]
MSAIIRVLWGMDLAQNQWAKVWNGDVLPQMRKIQIPQFVYVYGKSNADRLNQFHGTNFTVVCVDKEEYPDGLVDCVRGRYLVVPWHYKLQLIRQAIADHGEVIYCDWDVDCVVSDSQKAFDALQGRELYLSAYFYKKVRHPYRLLASDKRIGISGNWMHFRDVDFLDAVMREMSHSKRGLSRWHDEIAMGVVLDREYKGWMGCEEWLRKYESPIMCQQSCRCPWRPISDDGFVVTKDTPTPFVWHRMFAQWSHRDCKSLAIPIKKSQK